MQQLFGFHHFTPLTVVHVAEHPLWSILAFVASAAVAGFTGWLAWQTRKLARQTEADVSAQWRPVVVGHPSFVHLNQTSPDDRLFACTIKNVGAGPALNVRASLVSGSLEQDPEAVIGVLAAGDPTDVHFFRFGINRAGLTMDVTVHYEDLARSTYTTTLSYGDADEHPSPHTGRRIGKWIFDAHNVVRVTDIQVTDGKKSAAGKVSRLAARLRRSPQ